MMRQSSIQDTAILLALCTWLVLIPAITAFAQGETHPTPDTSKPWTRKAAFRASTNQIVLHYGEGKDLDWVVDILAEGLSETGYPAIAVPGGPKEKIEMFVGRKMPGTYTEDDLAGGILGMHAERFFKKYVTKPVDP